MVRMRTLQTITLIFLFFATLSHSLPLSTSSRWIVDSVTGHRVKLRCVNWPSHLQTMLAEGLNKQPLDNIAAKVVSHGFNCVRLTWATFMFTRPSYGNVTVAECFDSLNLTEAKTGIAKKNPFLLNLTLLEAYDAVVDALGANGVMVVLDNHVSEPKWCCSADDGNGFFGDKHFHPREWLRGLTTVAKRFKGKSQVVAMSMRNELRGPHENEHDWYHYMEKGARKIHKENPNVLVIVAGLSSETDLTFLKRRSFGSKLDKKLVHEAHWYSFGKTEIWKAKPLNQVCANDTAKFYNNSAFVLDTKDPVPLFVSEFGVDERGVNRADNRYLGCFLAFAADRDVDYAYWALQGSYYLRSGLLDPWEVYGVLDFNWEGSSNPKFHERFDLIQKMIQDPTSNASTHYIMYHPLSGRCVRVDGNNRIRTSDCTKWSQWSHEGDGSPIKLVGTSLCLKAVGHGHPAILSTDCSSKQSAWERVSESKLHIAAIDENGIHLCLEQKSSNPSTILTKKCTCAHGDPNCRRNPEMQWFQLISSNMQ